MDLDLEIVSYQRVGPIRFGMAAPMLEAAIGPATKRRKSRYRKDEVTELRYDSALQIVVGDAGVVEVTLYPAMRSARFGDYRLFDEPPRKVLADLCALDGDPREIVGIVVLLKLGISLGGFQRDDEPEQRSVTAFARGRFDSYGDRLVPFTMPAG